MLIFLTYDVSLRTGLMVMDGNTYLQYSCTRNLEKMKLNSNLWHIGDRLPLIQMFEDGRFCLCCRCADRLKKDIFRWKTLIFCGSMESAANRSYKENFRTIWIRPDRNAQHSRSKTTFNGSGSRYLFVNRQTEHWQTGFHHFSYLKGTQEWEFFWLRFWNLYFFVDS
jgi:hypothetical protein